jgi:Arc/MetJ family transcription regulator
VRCAADFGTVKGASMRTTVEIDEELIESALKITGLKTKRAAVEEGLRTLVHLEDQKMILDLAGKVQWLGDLNQSREGRLYDMTPTPDTTG